METVKAALKQASGIAYATISDNGNLARLLVAVTASVALFGRDQTVEWINKAAAFFAGAF